MIIIKNLSKSYGSNKVLSHINLELDAGKIYGIVGSNGSGKTTLFRCISGLTSYNGIIESQEYDIKNNLGLLCTIPFLFDKITGKEYIRLLCNARNIEAGDIDNRNIFDLPLNKYAENYSTGMKKKLALTAILMQKNKFYIFDEPFNGVDIQSNMVISAIIKELKKLGKTVLISSHIFSTLKESCDKIFLLKEGKIIRIVNRNEFDLLENEIKNTIIDTSISNLNIE